MNTNKETSVLTEHPDGELLIDNDFSEASACSPSQSLVKQKSPARTGDLFI